MIFISGLAIPGAFGADAPLFVTTYAGVRFLHLALYADASRRGNASWTAIAGFASTVTVGIALLVVGSFLDEAWRVALWTLATAIDYAGPAWLTRERLRGLQRVAVAHFAERYGAFVIICLGESIVAIGLGAAGQTITAALVATVASGVLVTVGLWWTYFDRFAAIAQERLRTYDDPVLAAADGYSYIHLLIVAGIILFAVGMRLATHRADQPLGDAPRAALCVGIALYLASHAAFRLRMVGTVSYEKLSAAAAILVVWALGSGLPAWALAATLSVILAVLCAYETGVERRPPPVVDPAPL